FHSDVDALVRLLDELGAPAHVVGHSYGGLLALQLALRRPALVRSLALFEPVAFGILDEPADDEARRTLARIELVYDARAAEADEAWLRAFVDWWSGAGAWDALAAEARAGFRSVGWKVFQEVVSLVADTTDRATY